MNNRHRYRLNRHVSECRTCYRILPICDGAGPVAFALISIDDRTLLTKYTFAQFLKQVLKRTHRYNVATGVVECPERLMSSPN
jgi:hypothetical protein